MKTCRMNDQNLMAYADSELGGEAGKQVEEHLKVCPECREEVALLQRLSKRVARARSLSQETEFDIEDTVMRRLGQQPKPRQGWWHRLRFMWDFQTPLAVKWAAASCSVILLTIGGIYLGDSGFISSRPPAGTAMGEPLEIQVETDLEADVFFFATEEAAVVWIEEDEELIRNGEARQERKEHERPA